MLQTEFSTERTPPVKRGITASSNSCLFAAITPMTSAWASLVQSKIAPGWVYSPVLRGAFGLERTVVSVAVDAMAGAATQEPTKQRRGLTHNSRAGNPKENA